MSTPALQYEGLYVEDAVEPLPDGEPGAGSRGHLRFYADGTVVSASVIASASAAQVWQWLRRENEEMACGLVTLDGGAIRFATRSPSPEDVIVDYEGTWTPAQLTLTTTSRWDGHVAQRQFTFVPAPAAPARTGEPRAKR